MQRVPFDLRTKGTSRRASPTLDDPMILACRPTSPDLAFQGHSTPRLDESGGRAGEPGEALPPERTMGDCARRTRCDVRHIIQYLTVNDCRKVTDVERCELIGISGDALCLTHRTLAVRVKAESAGDRRARWEISPTASR